MNKSLFFLLWISYPAFSEIIDPDEFMKEGNERVSRLHALVADQVERVYKEQAKPEVITKCLMDVMESGLIVRGDSVGKFKKLFDNADIVRSNGVIAVPTKTKHNSNDLKTSAGPGRQWFLIVELDKDQKISSVYMAYRTIKELVLMK